MASSKRKSREKPARQPGQQKPAAAARGMTLQPVQEVQVTYRSTAAAAPPDKRIHPRRPLPMVPEAPVGPGGPGGENPPNADGRDDDATAVRTPT
jgi:hypothetical protein